MNTQTITMYPVNMEQTNALQALAKALKIKFEITKQKPYNPEFVDMVLLAEEDIRQGKGEKLSSEEFDNLWK